MLAFSGVSGQAPPDWYAMLAAAEAWGVPPWRIEAEASAEWMDRFVAVTNERAAIREREEKRARNAGTGRRLI